MLNNNNCSTCELVPSFWTKSVETEHILPSDSKFVSTIFSNMDISVNFFLQEIIAQKVNTIPKIRQVKSEVIFHVPARCHIKKLTSTYLENVDVEYKSSLYT